jgi:hypothetical protein
MNLTVIRVVFYYRHQEILEFNTRDRLVAIKYNRKETGYRYYVEIKVKQLTFI